MPEVPSAATVSWAWEVATVTVHGGLDPDSASQVRERIAEVAGSRPGRLVLDLTDVSDRYGAECLALIAVARHLLPQGCALDVRSESRAVREILAVADGSAAQERAGTDETEAVLADPPWGGQGLLTGCGRGHDGGMRSPPYPVRSRI